MVGEGLPVTAGSPNRYVPYRGRQNGERDIFGEIILSRGGIGY